MSGETIIGKALDIVTFLMAADKETLWDLSVHKDIKKRSLTQNSYYWVLLEKLAVKQRIPKMQIHNTYLRDLGLIVRIADKPVYILLPDTEEAEMQTLKASDYHLAPRKETKIGTDNKVYRWYIMLRGSSDMTVDEMSALVDLAIADAKENGIETISPDELAHMRELEKANEQKRQNKGNINTTKST